MKGFAERVSFHLTGSLFIFACWNANTVPYSRQDQVLTGQRKSLATRVVAKSRTIVQEEGVLTWMDRAARLGIVSLRRMIQSKAENTARWRELEGRFRGERAFVVGNGPSLNLTPMHLLAGEHSICFNRFYLMYERLGWRPSMYAVSDDRVGRDIGREIVEQVLPTVDYAFFPDIHPYNVDFRDFIPALPNVYWLHLERLGFCADLPYAGMNKTVANVALQVLAYLGFDPIYLIGVDMSYERPESVEVDNARDWTSTADDDPNHFDPRYFGRGRRYHHPRMDETLQKYLEARAFMEARGVTVVNAGVGGQLEVFPRLPFRSLFQHVSVQGEQELIEAAVERSDAVVKGSGIWDLPLLSSPCEKSLPGYRLSSDAYQAAMPAVLRTHLPFGPLLDGTYLLVERASGPAWD